jgi:NAD(P)-dependent dehydrogenase (short-subunit alcohol dehydrogenase family)
MPSKLEGKVALVTGGGSGFGAAISRRFVSEGAKVFIGDINLAGADVIAKEFPGQVITGQLNVTKRDEWDAAVEKIKKEFGRLDILVNNAGTSYKNKPTLTVTLEEYQRTFDVNCLGIFHSQQAVFKRAAYA